MQNLLLRGLTAVERHRPTIVAAAFSVTSILVCGNMIRQSEARVESSHAVLSQKISTVDKKLTSESAAGVLMLAERMAKQTKVLTNKELACLARLSVEASGASLKWLLDVEDVVPAQTALLSPGLFRDVVTGTSWYMSSRWPKKLNGSEMLDITEDVEREIERRGLTTLFVLITDTRALNTRTSNLVSVAWSDLELREAHDTLMYNFKTLLVDEVQNRKFLQIQAATAEARAACARRKE